MNMKRYKNILIAILALALSLAGFTGCSKKSTESESSNNKAKETIVLLDPGFGTTRFLNSVASFILENGYGYKTEISNGSVAMTFQALRKGDIDVHMDIAKEAYEPYKEALESGDLVELGTSYRSEMGLYVPTYLIKGDPERGIEPMAPELKSIYDLPKYWEVFKDIEDPSKGLVYSGVAGWHADDIISAKMDSYNLKETFNILTPGSETAVIASIAEAYEKGKAWVGFYYTPTWVCTKYDMTLLEDAPYKPELYTEEAGYTCEFPNTDVVIAAYKDFPKQAPDAAEFFSKLNGSSEVVGEAMVYIEDNEASEEEAAINFLKKHEDMWTQWVPQDVAAKVKEALK